MTKSILILESSKLINSMIYKELSKNGFEVQQAYSYKQASKLFKENEFDIIISSLYLPDNEGVNLIKQINLTTNADIIILTSNDDENLRKEIFKYGVLDYILKDQNILLIIQQIQTLITKINQNEEKKILVIDDSKVIQNQIQSMLQTRHYNINEAKTAKNALEFINNTQYNLIILDMELPDMHGQELLVLIKNSKLNESAALIVVSGTANSQIIRNVLKNGANDFLRKPLLHEEFILKIDLWIDYFGQKEIIVKQKNKLDLHVKNLEDQVNKEIVKNKEKDMVLFHQSRMAAMGEMIDAVGHQWMQPVTLIKMQLNNLLLFQEMGTLDESMIKDIVSQGEMQINHLVETIGEFRSFFRDNFKLETVSIENIINSSLLLLKDVLKKHSITIHLQGALQTMIQVNPSEFKHVIINILNNAKDAFEENNITNKIINFSVENVDHTMKLLICDNAGGIPNDVIDHIFASNFTTKEEGKGTGIGLYMSQQIIEKNGGSINVHNQENGACFTIEMMKA